MVSWWFHEPYSLEGFDGSMSRISVILKAFINSFHKFFQSVQDSEMFNGCCINGKSKEEEKKLLYKIIYSYKIQNYYLMNPIKY